MRIFDLIRVPASLSGVFVALIVCLAILPGCSRQTTPTGELSPDNPIRVAYQDRIADAVSIVAIANDYFREEGLMVKGLRFSSGPACSEALYSGSADVGTMGDTTAIIATARKAPVTIVASHGGGEHRHRIVVAASSAADSISDLKGKRVAVKKGTSTYGGLLAYLVANGMRQDSLKLMDMRPSDMIDALSSGSIDAIVASEPTPSLAEQRGGRVLATLGGLGNSYPILLMMREEFLRERPDAAARFLKAMSKAAAFINNSPDEATVLLSKVTGLAPDVVAVSLKLHSYAVGLDAATEASLTATARFLQEQKIVETAPDMAAACAAARAWLSNR